MASRDSMEWRVERLAQAARTLIHASGPEMEAELREAAITAARDAAWTAVLEFDEFLPPPCDSCGRNGHPDEDCPERAIMVCPVHGDRTEGVQTRRYYPGGSIFNSYDYCIECYEAPGSKEASRRDPYPSRFVPVTPKGEEG